MAATRLGTLALAAALAVSVVACEAGGDEGVDRDTFVAAYADLRRAAGDSLDEAARDSILARHGVTADELRAFVERHSDDPATLAETWREVMDSLAPRDTARERADSARARPDTVPTGTL